MHVVCGMMIWGAQSQDCVYVLCSGLITALFTQLRDVYSIPPCAMHERRTLPLAPFVGLLVSCRGVCPLLKNCLPSERMHAHPSEVGLKGSEMDCTCYGMSALCHSYTTTWFLHASVLFAQG